MRCGVKETYSVLALYDTKAARETATAFCDELVERFWSKCGFDVQWVAAEDLIDREKSKDFSLKAITADYLVCALEPEGELTWEIQQWLEVSLEKRHEREG